MNSRHNYQYEMSISEESVTLINAKIFSALTGGLESVLIRLSDEIAKESNLSRERVFDIWNKIVPDCQTDFSIAIKNEVKLKEQEEKKHKKREEDKSAVKCEYKYGEKASKPNQLCGDPCKGNKKALDGKNYCAKHLRQVDSKKKCVFVYGSKAANPGTECGARIGRKSGEFDVDGEYEGKSYKGCLLCQKHQRQVIEALYKKKKQCTHIAGKNSKTPGKRCTSICKSGTLCAAHAKTGKKTAEKSNKKDVRKTLKKGKVPEPKAEEESADESEVPEEESDVSEESEASDSE